MKKILFLLFQLYLTCAASAQVFDTDTLQYNGDINKYINFVILGDGYTSGELGLFNTHAQSITNDFFNQVPYTQYKNYFNVITIKVISPQSGIKHPHTQSDCPPLAQFPIANPNNYFGTTFDFGLHRLVYPSNVALVGSVVASNFPAYDQILMVANSTQYGGGGGAFAVGTAHALASKLMLHECAHSFVALADEYWAGDAYASEKRNMTNQVYATPSLVKWANWLGVSGTGIYQHCCGGTSAQWYKPSGNCMMESLNANFCPVCVEGIVERIHDLVNPIVSFTPASQTQMLSTPTVFKLNELILPIPNTLSIKWKLNGNIIASNVDQVTLLPGDVASGTSILTATVLDTTNLVRAASHATNHVHTVTWNVSADNTLPLGIINFDGRKLADGTNKLTWQTVPMKDCIYFEVEKGYDGRNFNAIGKVFYDKNNTAQNYFYIDASENHQTVFYRLKQFDTDGECCYTDIVRIEPIEIQSRCSIYPNPAETELHILIAAGTKISAVNIFDLGGRKVMQQVGPDTLLSVKSLAKGYYQIEVRLQSGEVLRQKLIKK